MSKTLSEKYHVFLSKNKKIISYLLIKTIIATFSIYTLATFFMSMTVCGLEFSRSIISIYGINTAHVYHVTTSNNFDTLTSFLTGSKLFFSANIILIITKYFLSSLLNIAMLFTITAAILIIKKQKYKTTSNLKQLRFLIVLFSIICIIRIAILFVFSPILFAEEEAEKQTISNISTILLDKEKNSSYYLIASDDKYNYITYPYYAKTCRLLIAPQDISKKDTVKYNNSEINNINCFEYSDETKRLVHNKIVGKTNDKGLLTRYPSM